MNSPQSHFRVFVAVTPGLEPWLVAELQELGLAAQSSVGGAELRATNEQLWMLHRESRLAEHVRVQLRSFRARRFDELIAGLERLPWHAYLRVGHPVDIHVTCHRSRLWHSEAVAQRTRAAISRSLRTEPPTAGCGAHDAQSVYVRITGDNVQPAIDASGEPLHRRGRRTFVGGAPLRETLAAALVRMLGEPEFQRTTSLWDPFCGSGCIPIEWAESKLRLSAGRDRAFAFEHWPIHDSQAYAAWLASPPAPLATALTAFGSDIDSRAIAAATANAERSSLQAHTHWKQGDFESLADSVPKGTAIVTNPPYGVRLGDRSAAAQLMRRLESLLTRRTDLRPAVVLLPDPARAWKAKLQWQQISNFHNGGLSVQVLRLT